MSMYKKIIILEKTSSILSVLHSFLTNKGEVCDFKHCIKFLGHIQLFNSLTHNFWSC